MTKTTNKSDEIGQLWHLPIGFQSFNNLIREGSRNPIGEPGSLWPLRVLFFIENFKLGGL